MLLHMCIHNPTSNAAAACLLCGPSLVYICPSCLHWAAVTTEALPLWDLFWRPVLNVALIPHNLLAHIFGVKCHSRRGAHRPRGPVRQVYKATVRTHLAIYPRHTRHTHCRQSSVWTCVCASVEVDIIVLPNRLLWVHETSRGSSLQLDARCQIRMHAPLLLSLAWDKKL